MDGQKISKAKRLITWAIAIGVLALVGFVFVKLAFGEVRTREMVSIGSGVYRADVAETPNSRAKGLSGRRVLENDEAMLLVFDKNHHWSIWMKGMNFPIDIVWLDQKRVVNHIEYEVQPDKAPHKVYEPPKPARYVLEIPAGQAKKSGIKVGVEAKFNKERYQ